MGRLKVIACSVILITLLGTAGYFLTKDSQMADQTTEETALVLKTNTGQNLQENNILEKNKHNAINILIENFYHQKAKEQKFAEKYQSIDIYSKGLDESGDYIIYAVYEMKIKDVETPVPGLETFYIKTMANGTYQMVDVQADQRTQDAVIEASQSEDVQTLIKSVERRYTEAKASDEVLRTALDDLQNVYQ